MKNRTTELLFGYWNDTRQGRPAPHRFDIEPAKLSAILPETLILEYATGAYMFRLAGTRICERFGRELRATDFSDLWLPEHRTQLRQALERVRDESLVLTAALELVNASGAAADLELLLLPLTLNGATNERFLGSMSCSDAPAWLGHERPVAITLHSVTLASPDALHAASHAVSPKLAIPQPLKQYMRPSTSPPRRRFRVIEGGRPSTADDRPR
ncbi:MAG: hypothetical protein RLZ98_2302 [Pseudomonadota bacterium]|jgi:hypothetical protein